MSAIIYTAKREIATGHTAGIEYNLEFGIQQNRREDKTKKRINRSKGGLEETLRFYHDRTWSVKTLYIDSVDLEFWREWFHSVDGGEFFTYDPSGTIAVPVSPTQAVLVGDTYTEDPINFHRASIAFKVRF